MRDTILEILEELRPDVDFEKQFASKMGRGLICFIRSLIPYFPAAHKNAAATF